MITAEEASTLRGAPRLIVSADGKIVSPGPRTASSGSAAHSFGAWELWCSFVEEYWNSCDKRLQDAGPMSKTRATEYPTRVYS